MSGFTGAVRGVSFADTDYLILASDVKFLRTLFLLVRMLSTRGLSGGQGRWCTNQRRPCGACTWAPDAWGKHVGAAVTTWRRKGADLLFCACMLSLRCCCRATWPSVEARMNECHRGALRAAMELMDGPACSRVAIASGPLTGLPNVCVRARYGAIGVGVGRACKHRSSWGRFVL